MFCPPRSWGERDVAVLDHVLGEHTGEVPFLLDGNCLEESM